MRLTGVLLFLIASLAQAGEAVSSSLYGTRVAVLKTCPVKGGGQEAAFAPAIVAAILPTLIDKAVDWAAAAAKAAGESKVYPAETGTGVAAMLKSDGSGVVALDKGFGCVVVTSGEIGQAQENTLTGNWKSKTLVGLGFARNPRFYVEMSVVRSADGSYFALKPNYLYYREPSQSSWWTSDSRDVSLSLSFIAPGQKEPFASSNLVLKGLRPGLDVTFGSRDAPLMTSYMPIASLDDISTKIVESEKASSAKYAKEQGVAKDQELLKRKAEKARKQLETFHGLTSISDRVRAMGYPVVYMQKLKAACSVAKKFRKEMENCPDELFWATEELRYVSHLSDAIAACDKQDATAPLTPTATPAQLGATSIQVTIVESRDGNEFMKFVGEVLDGSSGELKKVVKSTLPSERAKAKDELQDSEEELLISAATERAKVVKLEAQLAQETDSIKKAELEGELLTARLKANQAYRKAHLEPRYDVSL